MPSARSAASVSAAERSSFFAGLAGIQDEGDGAIVGEVDIHHGLKNDGLHPESSFLDQSDQVFKKFGCQSRLPGPVEARPPSLSRRSRKGELGDGQDLAACG